MKILFLTTGSEIVASSRTRVYQYLPYLEKAGIQYSIIPMNSDTQKESVKGKINKVTKYLKIVLLSITYDVVFIQKVLLSPWVQNLIKLINRNIIFDFDDAIFTSPNMNWSWYTKKKVNLRLSNILKISRWVILENIYTKEFVSQFNKNILMITGPVDCKRYFPIRKKDNENIVIGWIGSSVTTIYLESLFNVFKKISKKYPEVIFELIGASDLRVEGINVKIKKWTLDTEVKDLQNFDIGIMPLPDNEWTRGKGGYKLLQYMAVGIPCVASPVGVNQTIIRNGINGFLVNSEDEWIKKISLLVTDSSLRKKLGKEGRRTVEDSFSSQVNFPKLKEVIFSLNKK